MAKAGKGKQHHSGAHGDARKAITRRHKEAHIKRLAKKYARLKAKRALTQTNAT